jgi:adenylosuccinate synthase
LLHLDTLTGNKELQICRAYKIDGKEISFFPSEITRLAKAEPVYETLPGWDDDITAVTDFNKLPENAKNYIYRIEKLVGKKIEMLGVGPKRTQTIFR